MISLEQVQLLEEKVFKAVEYVKKITAENQALLAQREELQAKLDKNQKRIDELEVHVMSFKEDQSRIEDGIIAALDRLSQFEEAFEKSLKDEKIVSGKKSALSAKDKGEQAPESKEIYFEVAEKDASDIKIQEDEIADDKEQSDNLSSEGELDIF